MYRVLLLAAVMGVAHGSLDESLTKFVNAKLHDDSVLTAGAHVPCKEWGMCNSMGDLGGCGPQQICCPHRDEGLVCTAAPTGTALDRGCAAKKDGESAEFWDGACPARRCNKAKGQPAVLDPIEYESLRAFTPGITKAVEVPACKIGTDGLIKGRDPAAFVTDTCTLRDYCAAMMFMDDHFGVTQHWNDFGAAPGTEHKVHAYFSAYKPKTPQFVSVRASGRSGAITGTSCSNGALHEIGENGLFSSSCAKAFAEAEGLTKDKMRETFTNEWCNKIWTLDGFVKKKKSVFCSVQGCDGTYYEKSHAFALANCPDSWARVEMEV